MPRQDGTPTIAELLTSCDDDDRPPLKIGDPVRFSNGSAQWVYGTIVAALDDNMFSVQLPDGSTIAEDAPSLWCTNWPRDPEKTWPYQEDCTHCPGKAGPDGPHKFGCALYGARQLRVSVVEDPNGRFRIV